VHALHNIHAALVPDAILIDTQPVSARPSVATVGVTLGMLDMCEWLDTVQAIDKLVAETIGAGLYDLQHQSLCVVTDTYENGLECQEIVGGWRGTRLPSALATKLAATKTRVTVRQEVRLRLLRRRSLHRS